MKEVQWVSEWLGHSFAVLGVDGSSLLTASQRCNGLISLIPAPNCWVLIIRVD